MIAVRTLLLAVSMLAGLVVAPTADAVPISRCTASVGTVVAVDFARWGGPVVRGCDTSRPKTGAQLLTNAGFRMTGTQHDGPAFVCRIGNAAYDSGTRYPTAADDPCVLTPPATAYWSYWIAAPGANRWTYSNWGAYAPQSEPEAGGVELWIFGGTRTEGSDAMPISGFPVCSPNSLRSGGSPSRCTPKTAAAEPKKQDRPREERSTPAPEPERGEPSRSATARPRKTPTATRPARSSTTPPTRTPPTSAPVLRTPAPKSSSAAVIDARPASDDTGDAGSALPLIVGIGLAAVLLAGGGVAASRRRRAAE